MNPPGQTPNDSPTEPAEDSIVVEDWADDSTQPAYESSPFDDESPDPTSDEELSGARIRQFAAIKRAAARARSFALIGAVACVVVGIELVLMTIEHVRAIGWTARPIGFLLFAIAAMMVGSHFGRRAAALHREVNAPLPLPPTPPGGPDFSTLSDGSHQWKNLNEIR